MKLTAASRYALAALVQLARRPGVWYALRAVAHEAGVPFSFMAKSVPPLTRAELVQVHAGYGTQLAPPANKITLLEVVELTDKIRDKPNPNVTSDPDDPLHAAMQAVCDRVTEGERRLLAKVTLAELAGEHPRKGRKS
jgi:Rrf2 family protein